MSRPDGSKNLSVEEANARRRAERDKAKKNAARRKEESAGLKEAREIARKTTKKIKKSRTTEKQEDIIAALDDSQLKLTQKKRDRTKRASLEAVALKAKGKPVSRKNSSAARDKKREEVLEREVKRDIIAEVAQSRQRAVRDATEIELELGRRELARRRLLPFIQKFNKTYDAGWVHEHLCSQLEKFVERIERKESPRLMIFMPPRHGKSEIASKNMPAWVLGKHPDWEIIASSYAVSLPIGFSRKVQETIQDKAYKQLFPKTKLHPKSQAAESWRTTAEGGYVAAGVGGGITGKGAHMFIIDDPVKDAQEADSDTQRQTVWDWWGSTAKTRLSPGGGVLVIQTRWHDDDLSGRMIEQMTELKKEFSELITDARERLTQATEDDAREAVEKELAGFEEELTEIDDWEIITYPGIAVQDEYIDADGLLVHAPTDEQLPYLVKVREKGEALHPSRYPIGRLRNMKRSMQPRHWSALYQQNPVPDEGIYFTKDMIRFTASIPAITDMYLFAAWDLAAGEKQQNDYSVGVVMGLDYQGQIHVLDMIRMKANIHLVAEAVVAQYKKFPSILEIGVEKGQLELALMPQLNKLLKKEKIYPTFNHDLRPISDKWVRARPLQGRMQMGVLMFPHNQTWTDSAVSELLRFPGGLHDDIVDALAWGVRMIGTRKEPPSPTLQNTKSWRDKLERTLHGQRISNTPMGA